MNQIRIAFVEDDRLLANSLAGVLKKKGWFVDVFYKAADFLAADMDNYSILILDLMMRSPTPIFDNNLTTGEYIFNAFRLKNKLTPILIVSGMNYQDINIDFNESMNRHISKPLRIGAPEVIAAIEDLCI